MKADAAAYAAGRRADYEDEHRMVHKDGSIRWFLARGRMVSARGAPPPRSAPTRT